MTTATKQKQYEWLKSEHNICSDWSLELFPQRRKERKSLIKNLIRSSRDLPFSKESSLVAPHNFEIKTFPEKVLETHYHGKKPKYCGNVDSDFVLGYCGWLDWEFRAEANFLEGEFKTGLVASTNKYTQDINEFKANLTEYFESTQKFGLPPFGEYIGNFFTNSNLPPEYIDSFRDLIKN